MAIITSRVGPFGGPYPIGNAAASGDGFQALLSRIGASGLDPNGRPIGSTGGMVSLNADDERELASYSRGPVAQSNGTNAGPGTANVGIHVGVIKKPRRSAFA